MNIFINESIFGQIRLPDYSYFLKKNDPELYKLIVDFLSKGTQNITPQLINIEIENWLYNSQFADTFTTEIEQKLLPHSKELVNLKTNPQSIQNANISSGKRKRKRIRTNRL